MDVIYENIRNWTLGRETRGGAERGGAGRDGVRRGRGVVNGYLLLFSECTNESLASLSMCAEVTVPFVLEYPGLGDTMCVKSNACQLGFQSCPWSYLMFKMQRKSANTVKTRKGNKDPESIIGRFLIETCRGGGHRGAIVA